MALPPSDWLDEFEQALEPVPKQSYREESGALKSSTLFVPTSADIVAPDAADSYRYLAWQQQFVFEDSCAIWDTLGKVHRMCASTEPQAGLPQYEAVEFNCPVAGALLQAFGALGVSSEVRQGWHVWRSSPSSVYGLAYQLPRGLPDWAVPAAAREVGRRAVFEALKTFGRAADLGRKKTFGLSAGALSPAIRFTPEGAFLEPVITESDLMKAIERAERRCPKSVAATN